MKITLYSDDTNLLTYWEKSLKNGYDIAYDMDELKKISQSIIILNFECCETSYESLIYVLNQNGNQVLILHRTPDFSIAKRLLKIGAKGYGNALMREHFLVSAIHTINDGMIWLYPEFTSQLISELPVDKLSPTEHKELLAKLSSREIEVAMLLKNGDTYKTIGKILSITPRTIKAHAQNIYKKLNVKDRLALALLLR